MKLRYTKPYFSREEYRKEQSLQEILDEFKGIIISERIIQQIKYAIDAKIVDEGFNLKSIDYVIRQGLDKEPLINKSDEYLGYLGYYSNIPISGNTLFIFPNNGYTLSVFLKLGINLCWTKSPMIRRTIL